ncbi:MAG: hypothetical protein Q9227_006256 [Pyrenula ochraceoflavens]
MSIKALFFDVFGTSTDWRTTVSEALYEHSEFVLNSSSSSLPSAVRLRASQMTAEDWAMAAQQWRSKYYQFTRSHDPESDFVSIDEHHYRSLMELLQELGLEGLWDESQLRQVSLVWHFLRAWPDAPAGISKLNTRFLTSTLSNGNLSLLSDLAKSGPLPFQQITSAEEFRAYKPSPLVYEGGARKLELEPTECALVAAHLGDLEAAKACGFKTVYVERPHEETWDKDQVNHASREGWVDIWIPQDQNGFLSLAKELGIP